MLPLLSLLACAPSGGDVTIARSDAIPTVLLVSWPARDDAGAARVDFGPDEALGWSAPASLDAGTWTATLVGLKADSTGYLQVVETVDAQERAGELLPAETGSLSSALPSLDLAVDEDGHWQDGFLVTTLVTNPPAALIIDPDGEIVWWYEYEGDSQLGRARLGLDGDSVLMMGVNAHNEGGNTLLRVSLAGEVVEELETGDSHHDFVEHADGSLAWLTHDEREVDGESVLGDSLTVRAADGSTEVLWSIWDWREYDGTEGLGDGGPGGPGGGSTAIWTHFNSLRYQDGAYLTGSLGLSAIMQIDATTGSLDWTFGSSTSDFADATGNGELLSHQHQFQLLDDSLLVFENGSSERGASRAVEFSFDPDVKLVEEIWSYQPDPDIYTFSLGNPARLDSGNTLVDFATGGQIDEVDPDGRLLWRLSSPLGAAFGYAEPVASIYGG